MFDPANFERPCSTSGRPVRDPYFIVLHMFSIQRYRSVSLCSDTARPCAWSSPFAFSNFKPRAQPSWWATCYGSIPWGPARPTFRKNSGESSKR